MINVNIISSANNLTVHRDLAASAFHARNSANSINSVRLHDCKPIEPGDFVQVRRVDLSNNTSG